MQNLLKLSICCLSYNHAKFINECISSIINQDYSNIEIIALDDGSSDGSSDILSDLAKNSSVPFKFIRNQENSGNIGKNFNLLLNSATGDLVMFISCDDKLIEESLKEKINMFLDDSVAFVCHSQVIAINDKSEKINSVPPLTLDSLENPTIDDILFLDYSELGSFYIQGGIFRKSVVEAVSGFDEDMICDDIILRTKVARFVKSNHLKFNVLKKPGVFYRRHSDNISSNTVRQCKGVIQYLDRYWPNEPTPKEIVKWVKYMFSYTTMDNEYDLFFINKLRFDIIKGLCSHFPFEKVEDTIKTRRYLFLKIVTEKNDYMYKKRIYIFGMPVYKFMKMKKDNL